MRRPTPERFDEWLELGHGIISRARDDHELQHVEIWAGILALEARAERLSRTGTPEPDAHVAPLLVKAKEAAPLLGPSFTPRKLYRLAAMMPQDCIVRHGTSLFFRTASLLLWASRLKK